MILDSSKQITGCDATSLTTHCNHHYSALFIILQVVIQHCTLSGSCNTSTVKSAHFKKKRLLLLILKSRLCHGLRSHTTVTSPGELLPGHFHNETDMLPVKKMTFILDNEAELHKHFHLLSYFYKPNGHFFKDKYFTQIKY